MATETLVGQKNEMNITVTEADTAAKYGSGLAPVLSTPHVVGVFESACKCLIDAHLTEGQSTVGGMISVKHIAPTPVGMKVNFKVEIVSVNKKKIVFKGEAFDECEKIAECDHVRFIIDYNQFMENVNKKAEKIAN